MKLRKKAFTLIEISIGIIISALMLAGIMHVFSSGMKGSTKGMAYQANMETATILMAQIEYDLLRAVNIDYPETSILNSLHKENSAVWQFYVEPEKTATVTYQSIDNSVVREVKLPDGKTQKTVFGQGLSTTISFLHFLANSGTAEFDVVKHAMWVELKVETKDEKKVGKNEPIELNRLIVIRSQLQL